jgi:hypothetical protein
LSVPGEGSGKHCGEGVRRFLTTDANIAPIRRSSLRIKNVRAVFQKTYSHGDVGLVWMRNKGEGKGLRSMRCLTFGGDI